MSASVLDKILDRKAEEIADAKSRKSLGQLDAELSLVTPVRGFAAALRSKITNRMPGVIAEIKKASPSKGLIRDNFAPAEHARAPPLPSREAAPPHGRRTTPPGPTRSTPPAPTAIGSSTIAPKMCIQRRMRSMVVIGWL